MINRPVRPASGRYRPGLAQVIDFEIEHEMAALETTKGRKIGGDRRMLAAADAAEKE
jgi:hypothetical protein